MKPYRQKTFDPANNLFAIGLDADGKQCSVARYDTMEHLRGAIRDNFQRGWRTEVAILNLSQLDKIMARVLIK